MEPADRPGVAASVPAVRGGIVSRRGLFGRLTEAARVTQVSAPPGSGKTFLLHLPTNLSVPEIAAGLSVSVNTVRTHTSHLYARLGAHHRTEAVERARALGLLAPSSRRS